MNTRTWTAILLATVCTALYGCAEDTLPPTATLPPAETSTPIPTPVPPSGGYVSSSDSAIHDSPAAVAPPPYYGLRTLEEAVLESDIIARVQLLSRATSTVSVVFGDGTTHWQPLVDFTFTVHEYLKGTGGATIVGTITGETQDTQELAVAESAYLLSRHDVRWDSRQAIVFLRTNYVTGVTHWLGYGDEYWVDDTPGYQVTSRHERSWLPQADSVSSGGKGSKGASSPDASFMLGPPGTTSGARSASGGGDTISLGSLKARIAELEAEANAGGTDEYRICIEQYYSRHRTLAAFIEQGMFGYTGPVGPVRSGQPAGILLQEHWRYVYGGILDDDSESNIGRHWFEGTDPTVAKFQTGRFWTDDTGKVRVMEQVVTSRPLPAGIYQFFYNALPPWVLVCGRHSPLEINKNSYLLSVTRSSERTVHEAFFDPVDIGDAVGADGANGVLKPAAFSYNGATTTISSLKWDDGTVTLELSPADADLPDYVLDFIDTTGTTTLSLASVDASTSTSWSVADAPWADGDLFMLRLRRVISDDATLSGLALSGIDIAFDPATTTYIATCPPPPHRPP